MSKYHQAHIYTKRTNLLDYFHASVDPFDSRFVHNMDGSCDEYNRLEKYYSQEREVKLILLVRVEGTKLFCRIKCPINPLPVCGEFEIPCIGAMDRFLKRNGWLFKEKISARLFE